MIGEVLFSKRTYFHRLAGVIIGSIVYRIIIAFVLRISLTADTVKRGAFLMQKNAPENPGHFYYDFKYGKR